MNVHDWIRHLNPYSLVALVRDLLIAEAARVGAHSGAVQITTDVAIPDKGVDARTDFPGGETDSVVPPGPITWQIKAGRERPDVSAELAKPGVIRDLEAGRDYRIIWSHDAPGTTRDELELSVQRGVAVRAPGRLGGFFHIEDLVRLALAHRPVVRRHGGPASFGFTHDQWAATFQLPFVPDDARERQIVELRRALMGRDIAHIHVFGESGVGKSRLVCEALSPVDLALRTLVAIDERDVDLAVFAELAANPEASLILVIDDLPWENIGSWQTRAAAARADIRLVTIGDRRSNPGGGAGAIEVKALDEAAVLRLLSGYPHLDEGDRRRIASLADGFPKLAVVIAESFTTGEVPSVSALLDLHAVDTLLGRMVPSARDRRHLARLALFDKVGFSGDLSSEAGQLCEVFGLDAAQFQSTVSAETGRLVGTAGRYRRVIPRVLAAWLIREALNDEGLGAVPRIAALPPPLLDAFQRQAELLSDDPIVDSVMREVLVSKTSTFRTASELDDSAASLINALALVVPDAAAAEIRRLVTAATTGELQSLSDTRRRQLVFALEKLLWLGATYEAAASSLFLLSLAENESWANNATGTLAGSFQVRLGGTELPFQDRLAWLRATINSTSPVDAHIALLCLGAAIDYRDMRTDTWHGARDRPTEWRPSTPEEDRQARADAWDMVLGLRATAEVEAAATLGNGLRSMVFMGLDEFVADSIGEGWSPKARAILYLAIQDCLRYDASRLSDASIAGLEVRARELLGDDMSSRIELLLRTEYWGLARLETNHRDEPWLIRDVANAMVTASRVDLVPLADSLGDTLEPLTVRQLFRSVGALDGSGLFAAALERQGVHPQARVGYFIGQASTLNQDEVDAALDSWASASETLPLLPAVVGSLLPSDKRAELIVQAVEAGRLGLDAFAPIMFGRWTSPLSAGVMTRLVRCYLDAGALPDREMEVALTISQSWLESHTEDLQADSALREAFQQLLLRAFREDPRRSGAMTSHLRTELAKQVGIEPELRLQLAFDYLRQGLWLGDADDEIDAVVSIVVEHPGTYERALVDFLGASGRSGIIPQSSLLSRVVRGGGSFDDLLAAIVAQPVDIQALLVNHIDFSRSEPDPLFVALLELNEGVEEFAGQASSRFALPVSSWTGPFSGLLRGRVQALDEWAASSGSQALVRWAARTRPALLEWAEEEAAREAERDN